MPNMTPDEYERIERIDALAGRWLARGDERPATEVWDAAAETVDALAARALRIKLEGGA
jgi:hypothetical protein